MRNLSATIEEVASAANEVADTSGTASDEANPHWSRHLGNDDADQLTDNAEATVDKVEQLNDLLSDIEEMLTSSRTATTTASG